MTATLHDIFQQLTSLSSNFLDHMVSVMAAPFVLIPTDVFPKKNLF